MAKLNLYLISQDFNNDYFTYDSAVVVARDAETARNTYPGDIDDVRVEDDKGDYFFAWCRPEDVKVTLLGEANEAIAPGIVCASYNAG